MRGLDSICSSCLIYISHSHPITHLAALSTSAGSCSKVAPAAAWPRPGRPTQHLWGFSLSLAVQGQQVCAPRCSECSRGCRGHGVSFSFPQPQGCDQQSTDPLRPAKGWPGVGGRWGDTCLGQEGRSSSIVISERLPRHPGIWVTYKPGNLEICLRPRLDADPDPHPHHTEMDDIHLACPSDQSQIGTLPSTDPLKEKHPNQNRGEVAPCGGLPRSTKNTVSPTLHLCVPCPLPTSLCQDVPSSPR